MRLRLLALLLLTVIFILASARVQFTTETTDILPSDSALRETLHAAQRFAGAQLLIVQIDGSTVDRDQLRAQTEDLAERLRALDSIESVRSGFSTEDGIEIRKRISPYATAFIDADTLAERSSQLAITEQIEAQRKRMVGFAGAFLMQSIREDPLDLRGLALAGLQASAQPGVHSRDGLLLDDTGTHALLLVDTRISPADVRPQDSRVSEIAATIDATELSTSWFGGARIAWETASSIERDVRITAGLGMLLLGVVLFIGFRSWRPLVGAVGPSLVAAGCASIGAWWASPIHGLQLGFSAALAGLAVDYWVHLYLACAAQPDQPNASSRYRVATAALRELTPALAVSAGSTALAFAVLTTSALPIVRVLGITGAAAAAGAFLGTYLAGPVAWAAFGRPDPQRAAPSSTRFATPVVAVAALLALFGLSSRFEPDPMALIATSPEAEATEQSFADRFHFTPLRGLVLLSGDTPGQALDRAHRVQNAIDSLGFARSSGPASLLPGPDTTAARRAALPKLETLQARLDLATEAAGLPPFEGAAARILDWAQPPPAALWDSTPLASRVTLDGSTALVTVPIEDATLSPVIAEAVSSADRDASLVVPGQLASQSMDEARSQLLSRAALGAIAVFIVLALRHRRLSTAALALTPAATAVAAALGAMVLSGQPWNPVSLAAMVPVLGLAVDYGVFMTERATRTAPRGVRLSALTTIAGFLTLGLAQSPALFGVGIATVAGVGLAAATALFVLPAVLDHRWPLGVRADPGAAS